MPCTIMAANLWTPEPPELCCRWTQGWDRKESGLEGRSWQCLNAFSSSSLTVGSSSPEGVMKRQRQGRDTKEDQRGERG